MRGNNGYVKYELHSRKLWFYHPDGSRELVGVATFNEEGTKVTGMKWENYELLSTLDKIDPRMFTMSEDELMLQFFKDIRQAYGSHHHRGDRPDIIVHRGFPAFGGSKEWDRMDRAIFEHDIVTALDHQIQVRERRLLEERQ